VVAAIHYNFHNFRDGILNDFLNLLRVFRLLNKERRFRVLLRILYRVNIFSCLLGVCGGCGDLRNSVHPRTYFLELLYTFLY
jgi:hypothetical protein